MMLDIPTRDVATEMFQLWMLKWGMLQNEILLQEMLQNKMLLGGCYYLKHCQMRHCKGECHNVRHC